MVKEFNKHFEIPLRNCDLFQKHQLTVTARRNPKQNKPLAIMCQSDCVNEVFISSLICRNNKILKLYTIQINRKKYTKYTKFIEIFLRHIKYFSQGHGLIYVDNSNITVYRKMTFIY